MKSTSLATGLLLAACPSLAHAIDVYPGCATPTLKPGHHTFYVDPVKGTNDGNGSAAKPWKDLNSVVGTGNKLLNTQSWSNTKKSYSTANPNGPIKAGDVIMLMSGNYGVVNILNAFNTDFVWLMAGPGQTPVISHIGFVSSAKWVVQGIKFLGASPKVVTDLANKPFDGQATVGGGDYTGTTNNIVFTADSFATADNTNGWTAADWVLKPYYSSFQAQTACTSLTNSTFRNVLNAVAMNGSNGLMQGNQITYFANDGVDVTSGNVIIRSNTFTNSVNVATNALHADAIQGWSKLVNKVPTPNSNVLIEKNVVVKTGDWHKTYLQGISIFDGKWDNLVIQNNSLVLNTTDGISVFGATNSKIINNTLVTSNDAQPMIWVNKAKDGTKPSNVIVRNNIAPELALDQPGVIYDHNLFSYRLIVLVNGKSTTISNTGQVSSTSQFVPHVSSMFSAYDTANNVYNLHLRNGSVAIHSGATPDAPPTDIEGKPRTAPEDSGAYVY